MFVGANLGVILQVTELEIRNYMSDGPGEAKGNEKQAPDLPDDLKCIIPRASMLYLLKNHLGYDFLYTKKKGPLMKGPKRHNRIRKFMIEMSRAL